MTRNRQASLHATIATCAVLAVLVIPVVNLIAFIVMMLPLWFVDDLGVVDLGHENNGFFIPNAAGGAFGITAIWLFCFLIFRFRPQKQAPTS